MLKFGTLWVGKPFSKIELTAMSSFIYHGHELTIYLYDLEREVPNGVIKKDAREILSEDKIFMVDNSYAAFSDIFRYLMVRDTGLVWTDTDNVCLRSDWPKQDYIFGMQAADSNETIAGGILKAPNNSIFISELIRKSIEFDKENIAWSEIGPKLVTSKVNELDLISYAIPIEGFYSIGFQEWEMLWDKKYFNSVIERSKNSYCIQIWNQMRNRAEVDGDDLPSGSAIEYFYNKYYLGN